MVIVKQEFWYFLLLTLQTFFMNSILWVQLLNFQTKLFNINIYLAVKMQNFLDVLFQGGRFT